MCYFTIILDSLPKSRNFHNSHKFPQTMSTCRGLFPCQLDGLPMGQLDTFTLSAGVSYENQRNLSQRLETNPSLKWCVNHVIGKIIATLGSNLDSESKLSSDESRSWF